MITNHEFLKRKGIFYLEKPVTKEEKEIAELLQRYYNALKDNNLNIFFSLFAEDAFIQSYLSGEEMITKKEYIKKIKTDTIRIYPFRFYDALIMVVKNNQAILTAFFLFRLIEKSQSKNFGPIRVQLEFIKNNKNIWQISRYFIL